MLPVKKVHTVDRDQPVEVLIIVTILHQPPFLSFLALTGGEATGLCFVHFWTLPIFLLLAAMALTQSARLPGPSWDEEVVPALRQRMFTETSLIVDFLLITSQVWRAKVEPWHREYQLFHYLQPTSHRQTKPTR